MYTPRKGEQHVPGASVTRNAKYWTLSTDVLTAEQRSVDGYVGITLDADTQEDQRSTAIHHKVCSDTQSRTGRSRAGDEEQHEQDKSRHREEDATIRAGPRFGIRPTRRLLLLIREHSSPEADEILAYN